MENWKIKVVIWVAISFIIYAAVYFIYDALGDSEFLNLNPTAKNEARTPFNHSKVLLFSFLFPLILWLLSFIPSRK